MDGNFVVSVPDGRRLDAWASEGSGATAVLVHLGTPSAGRPSKPMSEAASRRGLRLVTYSRPGYGRSTRAPGRSVADCAVDVAAVAAHLGLERLLVVGWSGGGPHALATGALLPDLVESVGTLAGVAPRTPELAWLDGMAEENREEFAAAFAGPETLERFLTQAADGLQNATAETIAEALGGLVTEVDRRALTDDLADYLAAMIREAVRHGISGWCDDDLAFTVDWGFSLEDIAVPVTVWQGRQDAMVPFAHGEWLAQHVPTARAGLFDDEGHISLVMRFGELLDDLRVG